MVCVRGFLVSVNSRAHHTAQGFPSCGVVTVDIAAFYKKTAGAASITTVCKCLHVLDFEVKHERPQFILYIMSLSKEYVYPHSNNS